MISYKHIFYGVALTLSFIMSSCEQTDLDVSAISNTGENKDITDINFYSPTPHGNSSISHSDTSTYISPLKSEKVKDVSSSRLGYSYHFDETGNLSAQSLFADINNFGAPVLDTAKMGSPDESITIDRATGAIASSRVYQSSLEYARQIQKQLNMRLMINVSNSFIESENNAELSTHTTEDIWENTNSYYGEQDIKLFYKKYTLNNVASAMYKARSDAFMVAVYSRPLQDVISMYGEGIVCGYLTGGRFWSLYSVTDNTGTSASTSKQNLSAVLKAGCDIASICKVDAEFSIDGSQASSESNKYFKHDAKYNCQVRGGDPCKLNFGQILDVKDIKYTSDDLKAWKSSLSDETQHTIIDFTPYGVYPISDAFFEINFQRTAHEYLKNPPTDRHTRHFFDTPKMTIARVARNKFPLDKMWELCLCLHTRYGDNLIFRLPSMENASDSEISELNQLSGKALLARMKEVATQDTTLFSGKYQGKTLSEAIPAIFKKLNFSTDYTSLYDPRVAPPYVYDCGYTDFGKYELVKLNEGVCEGLNILYNLNTHAVLSWYSPSETETSAFGYGLDDFIKDLPRKVYKLDSFLAGARIYGI